MQELIGKGCCSGRHSFRILSLTRPLVVLWLFDLVGFVLLQLALVDIRRLTPLADAQHCAGRVPGRSKRKLDKHKQRQCA